MGVLSDSLPNCLTVTDWTRQQSAYHPHTTGGRYLWPLGSQWRARTRHVSGSKHPSIIARILPPKARVFRAFSS